jgi:hypothetical protein
LWLCDPNGTGACPEVFFKRGNQNHTEHFEKIDADGDVVLNPGDRVYLSLMTYLDIDAVPLPPNCNTQQKLFSLGETANATTGNYGTINRIVEKSGAGPITPDATNADCSYLWIEIDENESCTPYTPGFPGAPGTCITNTSTAHRYRCPMPTDPDNLMSVDPCVFTVPASWSSGTYYVQFRFDGSAGYYKSAAGHVEPPPPPGGPASVTSFTYTEIEPEVD